MPKKILIVDDEPDILEISAVRLRKNGYQVDLVEDAEKALVSLQKDTPDLILLDLLLPQMQGTELCQKLKAHEKFKHIPIILFTASLMRVTQKLAEIGAEDYIFKPFEANELLEKIKKYIG